MSDFGKLLIHTLRLLRKSPGYTLSALLILTLGIGANTAIFGLVDALLLHPLPVANADSVVSVYHVPPQQSFPGFSTFAASAANFYDWRKQSGSFASITLYRGRIYQLGGGSRPQSLTALLTEAEFFRVTGIRPAFGRAFTAEECQPGRDDVAILSHSFARSRFGSPQKALGATLDLNGRQHRIIGVMPSSFYSRIWFPANRDAIVPLALSPDEAASRGNHNLAALARLRDNISLDEANQELNVISDRLARAYPEENKGWGAIAISLSDNLIGDVRPALLTLLGAVGFVLLIACANTANLVLVRTLSRRKEFAIRAALGAGVLRLLLPVLLETTLLALAGGALGLLFARYAQTLVINALSEQIPGVIDTQLNLRVLAFTMAASLLTGIAAGLIAAWGLIRSNVNDALKAGLSKTDADSSGTATRSALVVAEVALSLMLLVGAGLMIRSFWSLHQVDPGFLASGVTTMTVPVPASSNPERNRFYDEFLPQVRRLPGVLAAGAIDTLPLTGGGSQQPIVIDGRPREVFALQPNVGFRTASPGYLDTMKIPLLAGRDFTEADISGQRPVVLISQEMARQFWPNENPLGKRLRSSFSPDISREVIGIVGDVKERGLDVLRPYATLYVPLVQRQTGSITLVVRTQGDSARLAPAITQILRSLDPELPLRDVLPMDELLSTSLAPQRFSMFLFGAMAALAFLLAAVGIYSVLAYNVRSRVQEISIRMALGAQVQDVVTLIVREGMKPTLLGIVLGTLGAWSLSRVLSGLVYGISTTDPYAFAAATLLLLAVAAMACLLPAWRAARVDPTTALRGD